MFAYCSAPTKSGKQCVNSPKKYSNFCGIHQNQYFKVMAKILGGKREDEEIMNRLGIKSSTMEDDD